MATELWDKVAEVNRRLQNLGSEAVQYNDFADQYGYKPQYVLSIVNEVLGPENFGYRIEDVRLREGDNGKPEIVARVTTMLRASPDEEWVERPHFGGSKVSRTEADASKGAVSNAVIKALASFGIGDAAYKGLLEPVYNGKKRQRPTKREAIKENGRGGKLNYVEDFVGVLNMSRGEVMGRLQARFGVNAPSKLSDEQLDELVKLIEASKDDQDFIEKLKNSPEQDIH